MEKKKTVTKKTTPRKTGKRVGSGSPPCYPAVELHVDKDGWTGGLQLTICHPKSGGYRLAGPKYNGSSQNVLTCRLTERDANEIRWYLNESFPPCDAG